MTDFFYFTKAVLTTSDLAIIGSELGFVCQEIESNKIKLLNVSLPGGQKLVWMPIDALGEQLFSFEIPEQDIIRGYKPVSSFIISYHIPAKQDLLVMLKKVLERFGGWIGCDESAFGKHYDVNNLDQLCST